MRKRQAKRHHAVRSQNYQRIKEQRARIHRKEKNQRQDRLHKLTTKLVRDFDVIVLEDIVLMQFTCLFLLLF
nr:transposase [uncultured Trichococcus sp.]